MFLLRPHLPTTREKTTRQDALDAVFERNRPDLDAAKDYTVSMLKESTALQREMTKGLMEDQLKMILKYNPLLAQQQKELYPNQANLREVVAKDLSGRIGASDSGAYPVPESLVTLLRQSRLEADNARGLASSGPGAAAEAMAVAQLGADMREQDMNAALTLAGYTPMVSASAMEYRKPTVPSVVSAASNTFNNLARNEYDTNEMKLGYLLHKKQDDDSGGFGGFLGSIASTFTGGFGGSLGKALGGSLF